VKGIIFNLLEDMVEGEGGPEAWDGLLGAAEVDGGYSALGDYPDAEFMSLVAASSTASGRSAFDVTRQFGEFALLGLARRYPSFFVPHAHTRDLLVTLNDVIHPEVRKLHPTARPPLFGFHSNGPDQLTLVYRSERRLCAFAEGMIVGAAVHFGESLSIAQSRCIHTGADECHLDITFRDERDGHVPTR
jgi:hypothetical protein